MAYYNRLEGGDNLPWKTINVMEQKTRFVVLANQGLKTMKALCEDFGISTKTGYKWINRVTEEGLEQGIKGKSRRPKTIPKKIPNKVETAFVNLRKKYPYWGARKLIERLQQEKK